VWPPAFLNGVLSIPRCDDEGYNEKNRRGRRRWSNLEQMPKKYSVSVPQSALFMVGDSGFEPLTPAV
jgi:hypothetical protein